MKKGNLSTQAMLGVKSFSRNGIQTNGYGEIVYFLVKPTNISVLSRVSVGQKVKQLMQLFIKNLNGFAYTAENQVSVLYYSANCHKLLHSLYADITIHISVNMYL